MPEIEEAIAVKRRRGGVLEVTRSPIRCEPDALLDTIAAAAVLDCSVRTLEGWRRSGGGPPFLALGRKSVRYRRLDLDEWLESRRRGGAARRNDPQGENN